jgi:hypothetical protein
MKILLTSFIFLIIMILGAVYSQPVAALDCTTPLTGGEASAGPPTLAQVLCPIIRVVNIAILGAGAIFVLMLLYGGVKLTLALGDPKGFEGAKNTITWAVIGFLIIIGVISILFIASRLFGIQFDFTNPFGLIANEIQILVNKISYP